MAGYTADTLDLSRLDAPSLAPVDSEASRARLLAEFLRLWDIARQRDPSLPPYDVSMLETDSPVILTEEFAYGSTLLAQAINDLANALRLAKAAGADLDHLAATYHRTSRKLIVPANPDTGAAAIYESDDDLRSRAQLAPEGLAEFGLTPGGYVYKVRSAFADRIKHVFPINRGAGLVELRVLGRDGDGTVAPAVLAEIAKAFGAEEGSQSTDILTVRSAEIVPVAPRVMLLLPSGPDASAVKAAARDRIVLLGQALHRLNAGTYREAIASAAHVGPVITVRVEAPIADIARRPEAAPYFAAPIVEHEVI